MRGDGPERSNLEALAQQLGMDQAVIFTGYVAPDEVSPYYRNAEMFVFASTSEVHPMVGLEAAACGLPIVARNKMGITKCVLDGETGYLVDVDNVSEFAERVLQILDQPDLHQQLARASQVFAEREWGHRRFAERVLAVYREAIASHAQRSRSDQDDLDDLGKWR